MSARGLLRLILALQAAGVALVAFALHRWLGAGWLLALLAGLACVVLARMAISANNFAMSARHGSVTPSRFALGPGGGLRLFLREFAASMTAASWHMPFGAARTRIHSGSSQLPVLLVHGYGASSGYWAALAARLDADGISHATLDLVPLQGDIDGYVPLLEGAARALCEAAGSQRLVLVCHSMGGLVARAWMRRCGTGRVARVITLGTPHHGTFHASLAPGANAQQMQRGSAWLTALAASERPETRALITSIWSHHDNIVAPQDSSRLPGARNIEFGGVGHVALGSDARVVAEVLREITGAPRQPA